MPSGHTGKPLAVALWLGICVSPTSGRALKPHPDDPDHHLQHAPHPIYAHHASKIMSLLETAQSSPELVRSRPPIEIFGTAARDTPPTPPTQAEAAVAHAVGALEEAEVVLASLAGKKDVTAKLLGSMQLEALADKLHAASLEEGPLFAPHNASSNTTTRARTAHNATHAAVQPIALLQESQGEAPSSAASSSSSSSASSNATRTYAADDLPQPMPASGALLPHELDILAEVDSDHSLEEERATRAGTATNAGTGNEEERAARAGTATNAGTGNASVAEEDLHANTPEEVHELWGRAAAKANASVSAAPDDPGPYAVFVEVASSLMPRQLVPTTTTTTTTTTRSSPHATTTVTTVTTTTKQEDASPPPLAPPPSTPPPSDPPTPSPSSSPPPVPVASPAAAIAALTDLVDLADLASGDRMDVGVAEQASGAPELVAAQGNPPSPLPAVDVSTVAAFVTATVDATAVAPVAVASASPAPEAVAIAAVATTSLTTTSTAAASPSPTPSPLTLAAASPSPNAVEMSTPHVPTPMGAPRGAAVSAHIPNHLTALPSQPSHSHPTITALPPSQPSQAQPMPVACPCLHARGSACFRVAESGCAFRALWCTGSDTFGYPRRPCRCPKRYPPCQAVTIPDAHAESVAKSVAESVARERDRAALAAGLGWGEA